MPSAYGTADVVRGHPELVGREHKYAHHGGNKHLILDDVQIQGTAADGSGPETWFGQVSLVGLNHVLYTCQFVTRAFSFHNAWTQLEVTILQASQHAKFASVYQQGTWGDIALMMQACNHRCNCCSRGCCSCSQQRRQLA